MRATPSITIKRMALDAVPKADYARIAAGSVFASPGFLELWRTMGGKPVVHLAQVDGRAIAAIPGIEYGLGPGTRFASMPDGLPGGVVVDPRHSQERARLAGPLLESLVRRKYAKIAVFDPAATGAEHPGLAAEPYVTLRGDISGPDWVPPDRTLRQEIRRASREGLEIQRFDWSRHGAGFLEMVAATARRHGERQRYPAALFRQFAELANRDDRVVWKYCERDACPVASQIYVLDGDDLFAWYECFEKRFASLRPHQLMRFEVCREMAARGARWLDLGATPTGAAGVLAYKRHWGVAAVTRVCQLRWAGLGRLARGVKGLAAKAPRWTLGR